MKEIDPILRRLGDQIGSLRRERGWTARDAAERSRLSLRRYHSLEAGEANISITRLAGVAEAFGVPLSHLLRARKKVVALLGLRGAGKSTIGPRLARALGCPFIELDEHIERAANLTIAEIFNLHGEAYYRKLESDCLSKLLERDERCVVEMPGGVVRNERAFAAIRSSCISVWLRARPEDHMKRVYRQGDRRPMANRSDAMGELRSILRERERLYEQADVTVDTSTLSMAECSRSIRKELAQLGWTDSL